MKKRIVALLLTLVMVISVMPLNVFAEEVHNHGIEIASEKKTINYVSFGDSMTNGYGLPGYNGNNGAFDYGYISYANQFAAYLAGLSAEEFTQMRLEAENTKSLDFGHHFLY